MASMRAAVFREPHQPLEIESVELRDTAPGEVLVRTAATGICHSDLHFVDGDLVMDRFTGGTSTAVLGHEGAGIVEEVGEGVDYVQPGDHVVACLSRFCGQCDQCLTGNMARCRFGRGGPTMERLTLNGEPIYQFVGVASYAEKMLLNPNQFVKIDAEIPLDRAAVLGCGVLTGVGAALNTAQVKPGSTVAVIGCGGVGLSVIAGAHIAGASMVIGIDRFANKEEMVISANGTHYVDAAQVDPVEAVKELTGGRGVDYAFDAVGRPELVRQAVALLGIGGLATIVGVLPVDVDVEIPWGSMVGEKRLMSCAMGSNRFRLDIPTYLEFYEQGRLRLDSMVSSRLSLDDINEAFRAMKAGEVARQVIVFDNA